MKCFACKETVSDIIKCSVCIKSICYGCSGVPEKNYRRMTADQRAQWRCFSCKQPNSPAVVKEKELVQEKVACEEEHITLKSIMIELKALRSDFNHLKDVSFTTLSTDITNIDRNVTVINTKLKGFDGRLAKLEQQSLKFEGYESVLQEYEVKIQNLSDENERMNQYSRSNNLEISGIPYKKNENLYSVIRDISLKVGLSLENDIDSVHRVRRYPASLKSTKHKSDALGAGGDDSSTDGAMGRDPAIIVRFSHRRSKDELLAAVRSRRGLSTADIGYDGAARSIYVNEHLTPKKKLLLRRAREIKAAKNYEYLWVRNGVINMRKKDNAPAVKILCEEDFAKIK